MVNFVLKQQNWVAARDILQSTSLKFVVYDPIRKNLLIPVNTLLVGVYCNSFVYEFGNKKLTTFN